MKRFFFLLISLLPLTVFAQAQFGYLSYQTVMKEMPEYAQAQQQIATLRAKYDAEAVRGEEEFQKKFVEFMQGQKDFPQSIMQKRQAELQTLMNGGVDFRVKAQELLAQAEKEAMGEVQKKLNRAILEVGVAYGYGFILNIDDNACPYINPVAGVDVSDLVRIKLGLIEAPATQPQAPAPAADPAPAEQPQPQQNAG
ncbi:MAG: OmpH family outer membrane protein [Bacteroidaceae bacterium]|jgi:outer membrane protein|nr:OmpH family outer membrane protein [Bacteroidaceae bacterium]